MFKIIAVVVLSLEILAACDNDTTGPTPTRGEITLELFDNKDNKYRSTGEGYNFANCEKHKIDYADAYYNGLGTNRDIDGFPEPIYGAPAGKSYGIYACLNRIFLPETSSWESYIFLNVRESLEFELVTLDGKARYRIFAEHREVGFDKERNGTASEFVIRYKLLGA